MRELKWEDGPIMEVAQGVAKYLGLGARGLDELGLRCCARYGGSTGGGSWMLRSWALGTAPSGTSGMRRQRTRGYSGLGGEGSSGSGDSGRQQDAV
jgi:hypothetical protein